MRSLRYYLFTCLVALSTLLSAQKIYIAENGGTRIQRSNGDGSSLEAISNAGDVGAIRDIVMDEERNRVFWVQNDGTNALIRRGDLISGGGTVQIGNVVDFVRVAAANQFEGLAIEKSTREIFVTSVGTGGSIYKFSLDAGTPITILPTPTVTSLFATYGIDIDDVNDKMYFVNQSTSRQIQRANTSGTSASVILNISGTLGTPYDVAVDPAGGSIYFSTNLSGSGRIYKANLDGSNPVQVVGSLPTTIKGISLDTKNGFVYWATGSTAVGRAKLDGTGSVNIVTGLSTAYNIAIDFSTTTPPKLYWTEGGIQEIHRINTNGTDFERYYFGSSPIPTGIAIDEKARYVYWTAGGQSDIKRGVIGETDFDSWETLINYPDATNGVQGIALDPSNHMMYFAYGAGKKIQRADFNAPSPITTVQDIESVAGIPYGVALDLVRGKVYYTFNDLGGPNTGTLKRANLDGSNAEVLITQSVTNPNPQRFMHDVKVDAKSGTVYWAFTQADGPATIYKADVNDVAGTVTPLIAATTGEVRGIEIDPKTDKLWWVCRGVTSTVPPNIMQAKLSDGSGISSLHKVAFLPPQANFIALDRGCEQPIAAAINLSAPLGQTVTADVPADSYFNSSDVITVTLTQQPTKGTASLQSDNTIDFTPNNGTLGTDLITYQICNQCGLCDQGTINITIPNEPPVIAPVGTLQGTAGTIVTIPLSSLISDPNNNLDLSTLSIANAPTSGAVASFNSNNELVLDYTGLTFSGTDNVSIRVCDQLNVCTTSAISIEVSSAPPSGAIIVHNGISANGDDLNAYMLIENIDTAPENKVTVYNRWGDKVFEVDNYDNNARRFEGKQNNGKELPSGVYFYKIEFATGLDDLTGYVTVKN